MKAILFAAILTLAGAAGAYAQSCQQGQVWCCKKNYSGNVECSCTWMC